MNSLRTATLRCSLLALMVACAASASGATFAELVEYLPDEANAIVVVNASALYASPIGVRDGWQKKYADGFDAAPLILPPSAERCVLASSLDLQSLRPDWEAAAMELSIDPTMGDIARRRGGRNDVLAGQEVAWIGQLCVFKFAPRVFGAITPATRQEGAHWVTAAKAGETGDLAPYLLEAVAAADGDSFQVVLAVDLADAFTEANLRLAAAQAEALKGIPPEQAAAILASVRGVKFGVAASDKLVGRVQLDFAQDVGPLAAVDKAVILKILAKAGAMLPEFGSWTAKAGPRSLALEGPLTDDGMRRIFSVLALDTATLDRVEPEQATSTTVSAAAEQKAMALATFRYFRGVGKYIDDISRLEGAGSLDQAVMWISNYARRVESLPTRNVDPELVQYGQYVGETFRAIVEEASGLASQAEAASQPVVTNYRIGYLPTARTVNYGGYFERMYAPFGYADIDPQATQANLQKSQQQIDQAVQQATKTLDQLQADQEVVRKKLNAKYGQYGLKF